MKNLKSLLFVALAAFIFLPVFSYAQVYINEIYYSPKTNAWIEIYNNTGSAVDLTQYKVLDAGASTNGHAIKLSSGTNPLPAYSYAVVATSNAISKYFASVSYPLFQSALAPSSGDTITLKSGSSVIDTVTFSSTQGAGGDGNSLQRQTDGTWIAATPTPGTINSNTPASVSDDQNSDTTATTTDNTTATTTEDTTATTTESDDSANGYESDSVWSANSSPASLPNTEAPIDFEISAGRDRLTSVGNDLLFTVTPVETQGILTSLIGYVWSFGDGTTGSGDSVHHVYKFPGEYSVVVNATASDQMAVDRLTVKVIDPQIALQKVPGGTEVINNSGDEINLEDWSLVSPAKTFTFPEDTLIPAGQGVVFADDVTGIISGNMQMENPSGKVYAVLSGQDFVMTADTTTSSGAKNLDDISASVSDISQKIVALQSQLGQQLAVSQKSPALAVLATPTNTEMPAKIVTSLVAVQQTSISTPSDGGTETPESGTNNTAQTATVFEASSSPGIVSRIFTWPIRGFNFIRSLFIEK